MSLLEKNIVDLQGRIKRACDMLRLDDLRAKISGLEVKMTLADFWTDQNVAKDVSRELAELKKQVSKWDDLRKRIDDLFDLERMASNEGDGSMLLDLEKTFVELNITFEKKELETLLGDEFDTHNAIVSIHAGAGGTDAMDWAGMLLRMISRYVENMGWEFEVLEESPSEEAGYKSITFSIKGRFAYGYLKSEAGVHRLVRISPFDAEKMRHTSFALVEVIPELDEVLEKQIEIDSKDLRVDTFMSSGKGGQSVNTTYSAVRITHIPTNTVVSCQNERSQLQNRESAMRVLKSKLFARMQEERAKKISDIRGGHKSPEWGNQIRSYVIHPYKMVKDHRTGEETQDVDAVLGGDLEAFIQAYLRKQINS